MRVRITKIMLFHFDISSIIRRENLQDLKDATYGFQSFRENSGDSLRGQNFLKKITEASICLWTIQFEIIATHFLMLILHCLPLNKKSRQYVYNYVNATLFNLIIFFIFWNTSTNIGFVKMTYLNWIGRHFKDLNQAN